MNYGSLAQLGEHLPYKQRVIGSNPITSICAVSAYIILYGYCIGGYGGIGRHKRLKISRRQLRAGSSPATRIDFLEGIPISQIEASGVLFLSTYRHKCA